ncbi:MAG: tRNA guanosine(34) transglycosylase Tgt [Gemmataceae bacterium]|nr:tRNA guanosine(34) transglycosylase Tgt [Gemmataceae bacterium]
MAMSFTLPGQDGLARLGKLVLKGIEIETPVFMPVGTLGTVKGITNEQIRETGSRLILGNTYHLALRPGADLVHSLGGLHRFMNWDGAILTDSGGFQIFSLAHDCRIDDHGASFRSHIDGTFLELTPEKAVEIQEKLGSDIAMCLDECPPYGCHKEKLETAVKRSILWASRCRQAARSTEQSLFAIVQGATDLSLREFCAKKMSALDFPGYALGGFSVGETPEQMAAVLAESASFLPENKPRYLMGVGRPQDLLNGIQAGIDMFDCVMPTRNARNGTGFIPAGKIKLKNAVHRGDETPLDSECPCLACTRHTRAYLHHLFQAEEMLGPILLTIHNLTYYGTLMAQSRAAIQEGRFESFRRDCLARMNGGA